MSSRSSVPHYYYAPQAFYMPVQFIPYAPQGVPGYAYGGAYALPGHTQPVPFAPFRADFVGSPVDLPATSKTGGRSSQEVVEVVEVVEQIVYGGPSEAPFEPYTIAFETAAGEGINLGEVLQRGVKGLIGDDKPAFTPKMGVKAKISIRIQIVGSKPYHRQIMSLRSDRKASSISKGKLAVTIAKELQKAMSLSTYGKEADGDDAPRSPSPVDILPTGEQDALTHTIRAHKATLLSSNCSSLYPKRIQVVSDAPDLDNFRQPACLDTR